MGGVVQREVEGGAVPAVVGGVGVVGAGEDLRGAVAGGHLGFGRSVVSEIEIANILVNLV